MPEEAARGFLFYMGGARRSLAAVSELMDKPLGTVKSWAFRYGWASLADELDRQAKDGRIAWSEAYLANLLPKALEQLDALLGDPDPAVRLRAVLAVADRTVGTPIQRSHVTTGTKATDPVTVGELASLAQTPEGRTKLLALATSTDD